MNCPDGHITNVTETRATPSGAIRRRRACATCGWRATTYEIVALNGDRPGDSAAILSNRQLATIRKLAKAAAALLGEMPEEAP